MDPKNPNQNVGPELLNPMIQALTAAGENELARKLALHGVARMSGVPNDEIARLWLSKV